MDPTWLVLLAIAVWIGYRIAASRNGSGQSQSRPPGDGAGVLAEVSLFAKDCGRQFLEQVDDEVKRLRSMHGLAGELAYQVAVADGAVWIVSAQNRRTPAPLLDHFFKSFWPVVHRAVQSRFADSARYFSRDAEELAHEINQALSASPPDQAAMRVGRLLASKFVPSTHQASFSFVVGVGVTYTTKLTATAEMLDGVGEVVSRRANSS